MVYTKQGGQEEAETICLENHADRIVFELLNKYKNRKGLEIGCGKGRWLKVFNNLDGFDISKRYIKNNKKEMGNRIWVDDINKPKRTRKKYDFVISTGLIEHFENSLRIIKNHLLFLNTNGICIITVPALGIDGLLQVETCKNQGKDDWREYGRRIGEKELDALMSASGLKNINIIHAGSILRGSPRLKDLGLVLFVLHCLGYIIQNIPLNSLEKKYGHMLIGVGRT